MEDKDKKSAATAKLRPNEDEDPITTSTDSEIFGTWTLVRDKNKALIANEKTNEASKLIKEDATVDKAVNRVEELKRDDHQESEEDNDSNSFKPNQDTSMEDFSDGISIISESDSAGRISPHPLLRQHLDDFNLKMTTNAEYDLPKIVPPPTNTAVLTSLSAREESQLKQRRRKRSSSANALQRADTTTAVTETPTRFPPIVRKGLTGLFYVGCLLGIVAFIGRLRNPEWGSAAAGKQLVELEQKLNDLELQNNLMRAEIDILAKQVNYLNTLQDLQKSSGNQFDPTKPNYLQDSKSKPYQKQAPAEKFIKSVPINANEPYFQQAPHESVKPNLELSEAMRDMEKIREKLKETVGQVNAKLNASMENESQQQSAYNRGEKKYERKMEKVFNKDYATNYQGSKLHRDSKENLGKPEYQKKFRERRQYSHEHDDDDDNDDDDDDDDSDDRFDKQGYRKLKTADNSREHYNKRHQQQQGQMREINSKENYGKHFKDSDEKHKKSGEYVAADKKDGNWHEQYMNHRANERRNNEKQRHDKNWFIERGDSREQVRQVDHHYR